MARRPDPRSWPVGPQPVDTGTAEVVPRPDRARAATLLVNGVPSSSVDLDDPAALDFEYLQQMAAVLEDLTTGPLHAVHLGAGGCSLARWLDARRPGSRQVGVDVDGALLHRVREWFELPRSPRLRLRAGDARAVLGTLPDGRLDAVVRDVFAGDTTPTHLTTTGFLREVRRVLRPDGLYLANCADRPPLGLARAEVATARAVFGDVALVAEPALLKGRRYGNLVLVARPSADLRLDRPTLGRALRSLAVPAHVLSGPDLAAFVGRARPREDAGRPGHLGDLGDPGCDLGDPGGLADPRAPGDDRGRTPGGGAAS